MTRDVETNLDDEDYDDIDPMQEPDVVAVHRVQKLAILDDMTVVPVTNWFNYAGNECEPVHAVTCVCGSEETGWFVIDLLNFGYATVH